MRQMRSGPEPATSAVPAGQGLSARALIAIRTRTWIGAGSRSNSRRAAEVLRTRYLGKSIFLRCAIQLSFDLLPRDGVGHLVGIVEHLHGLLDVVLVLEVLEVGHVLDRHDRGDWLAPPGDDDALFLVGGTIYELGEVVTRLTDADLDAIVIALFLFLHLLQTVRVPRRCVNPGIAALLSPGLR